MIYGKKPIMSAELERQVMNAVAQFQNRQKWKQWGLHRIREQGAAILLQGPAGCGKTVIANYLALKVRRKGIKEISYADFGSQTPGESARNIRQLFKDAAERNSTVFLDECEAILVDRTRISGDMVWMMEVINETLVQIAKYKFLVILASNFPQIIDRALYRRLLAIIDVPVPERPERIKLWKQKIPDVYPVKLSEDQLNQIATLQITGSEIETTIINVSSDALRSNKKPTFKEMFEEAEKAARVRREQDEYEAGHQRS